MIRKSGYRFSEKICHFSTAFGGVTPATAAEKSEFSEQESASDQRFCKRSESAPGRLEKPSKNPIYSITC
jgi:hypothetical protein